MAKLLSRDNPERITLRAGRVIDSDGTLQVDDSGFLYLATTLNSRSTTFIERWTWPGLVSDGGDDYQTSNERGTPLQEAYVASAIQPSTARDSVWFLQGNSLVRHVLGDASGRPIGQGDPTNAVARPQDYAMDAFVMDSDVIYFATSRNSSIVAEAWSFPSMVRMSSLDVVFPGTVSDFDIKTVNGLRHIVHIDEARLLHWREQSTTTASVDLKSQMGEGAATAYLQAAMNTADPREPYVVVYASSGDFTPYLRVATFSADGSRRGPLTELSSAQAGGPERPNTLLALNRTGDISGLPSGDRPIPTVDSRVRAQVIGQSADVLTEAQEGIFREVREVFVEVELGNVTDEFLLNPEWYFVHDGYTYQMRSVLSDNDATIASFVVEVE